MDFKLDPDPIYKIDIFKLGLFSKKFILLFNFNNIMKFPFISRILQYFLFNFAKFHGSHLHNVAEICEIIYNFVKN
jgi:hypothetical protein